MVNLHKRLQLERQYHESEDQARNRNSLIGGVYASGLFDEAEAYHLEALGEIRGARVLDYGCGGGGSTARLAERGAQVTGFDISHTRLAEASGRLRGVDRRPPARLLMCAAESLPFADASFDCVFGKQILHHLELDIAIPEIIRVLRPGGRAAFLEPLVHNPVLQAYRRLTPHLRSSTEQALSMRDLNRIASHFKAWRHSEFCLFALWPVLVDVLLFKQHRRLTGLRRWLQQADRRLMRAVPPAGRYAWETVITLER